MGLLRRRKIPVKTKEGIYPNNDRMCFQGLEAELKEVMEHRKYVIASVQASVFAMGRMGNDPLIRRN